MPGARPGRRLDGRRDRSRRVTRASFALALAGLLLAPWIAGCGASESAARWSDGTLTAIWRAAAPVLQLRRDGAALVELAATRRERLGQSAFQSSADGIAWRSDLSAPGWAASLLTIERSRGDERPIASILRPVQSTGATLVIWCAATETPALEHLYAFLLHSTVETPFDVKDPCGVLGDRSHANPRPNGADLLRRVADLRSQRPAALQAPGRRWRVVDVVPRLDGNEPLNSVALVRHADGPVPGVRVTFARDPHLACTSTTDGEGVARCTMVDTHGHAPHDAGAAQPPTVVTFAGRVESRFVDVPVVAVVETPRPTRCLTNAVPASVAAGWTASCRGFASRTWAWPEAGKPPSKPPA